MKWRKVFVFISLFVACSLFSSQDKFYADNIALDLETESYNILLDKINNEEDTKKDVNKAETLRALKLTLNEKKAIKMELWEENEKLRLQLNKKIKKDKDEDEKQRVQEEAVRVAREKNKREKEARERKLQVNKKNEDTFKEQEVSIGEKQRRASSYTGSRHNNLLAPSGVSVEDIDKVLKGSRLEGYGKVYIYAEEVTGVNAAFLASIAILESNWGRSRIAEDKNNLYGYGAYNASPYQSAYTFKTKAHGTIYVAAKLRENYLDPDGKYYNGPSVEAVNIRYSVTDSGDTNFRWSQNVKRLMKQMNCH